MQALNPNDLQPPAAERWQDALTRFERVCRSEWELLEDGDSISLAEAMDDGNVLLRHAPLDEAAFDARCKALGLENTAALKTLFCQDGGFTLCEAHWETGGLGENGWLLMQTLDRQSSHGLLPLSQAIENNYGPGVAAACFGEEIAAALDANFIAFASVKLDDYDEWTRYLLIDRQGRFGSFLYQDDAYPDMPPAASKLLQEGLSCESLDVLMQTHIQAALGRLFAHNDMDTEVPGWPLDEI